MAVQKHEANLRKGRWRALALVFLSIFALAMTTSLYVNHTNRENNKHFCDLVTTLDDAYKTAPPQSPTGRKVAEEMHELRKDLGC
jgi:hypothetical protein